MTIGNKNEVFSTFKLRHNDIEHTELTDGEKELFNKLIDFEPNTTEDADTSSLWAVALRVDGTVEQPIDMNNDHRSFSPQDPAATVQTVSQQAQRPHEQRQQRHQADGSINCGIQRKKSEKYKQITFLEPNTALFDDKSTQLNIQQQQKLYDLNRRIVLDHCTQENELILEVVEQPRQCRVSSYGEKDRRPIDPAPIVKLDILSKAEYYRRHSRDNAKVCFLNGNNKSSSSSLSESDGMPQQELDTTNNASGDNDNADTEFHGSSNNSATSEEENEDIEEDESIECPFYLLHASLWSVDMQTKYDLLESVGTNTTGKINTVPQGDDPLSTIPMTSLPSVSSPGSSQLHQVHHEPNQTITESLFNTTTLPATASSSSSIKSTSSSIASTTSSSSETTFSATASCKDTDVSATSRILMGSVISSPSFLKDYHHHQSVVNKRAYFFAFPDLSIRITGHYRLQFSLIDLVSNRAVKDIFSEPFTVYSAKGYPGMKESSPLSRYLAKQGLKLTVRKHVRSKKSNTASSENTSTN